MAVTDLLRKKNYIEDYNEIRKRKTICRRCDHNKGGLCGRCGCVIMLKTKLKTENCPEGFWPTLMP